MEDTTGARTPCALTATWVSPCGRARLHLGDCKEILFWYSLAKEIIDAIVSDPPWGINADTNYTRFTKGVTKHHDFGGKIVGDAEPFDPRHLIDYPKVALWGAHCFAGFLPLGNWLFWLKKRDSKVGKFLSDGELCWLKHPSNRKPGPPGVYFKRHIWDGFDRESERGVTLHATQKPVAVMDWTLERARVQPGESVCDPYMGAGATGVAAIQRGCRFIGIEIKPEIFEIARGRIEQVCSERGM